MSAKKTLANVDQKNSGRHWPKKLLLMLVEKVLADINKKNHGRCWQKNILAKTPIPCRPKNPFD